MGKRGEVNPIYGVTDSVFFSQLRSSIRSIWRNSKPRKDCILAARIPCQDGSRKKWQIVCADCGTKYYLNEKITVPTADGKKMKTVKAFVVHHKIECGQLKSFADLSDFAERTFCKPEFLEVLCWKCHTKAHSS